MDPVLRAMQLIAIWIVALVADCSALRSSSASNRVVINTNNVREGINRQRIRHSPLLHAGPNDVPIRGAEWARQRGMEPGYGGIWPGNPDAKKYKVTVKSKKTGEEFTAMVPNDRYIYFYFEEQGIDLPIINQARMCRQGCCTICTAKVEEGKVKMDAPLGLLKDFRDKDFALTCCSYPRSDIVCVLQDEDEMYVRQWSEGFEGGGVEWGGFFLDED